MSGPSEELATIYYTAMYDAVVRCQPGTPIDIGAVIGAGLTIAANALARIPDRKVRGATAAQAHKAFTDSLNAFEVDPPPPGVELNEADRAHFINPPETEQ